MRLVNTLKTLLVCMVARCCAIPSDNNAAPMVSGRQFNLNGKVQRFTGTNAWWLGHLTSDDDVDAAMSEIASGGLQVVRVWGFGNSNTDTDQSVYYQLIQPNGTSINYGSNGISRLDSAISHAEKYNLKLILPLLNNWNDLGGINTYTTAFGGSATSFFTDSASQDAYRSWISFAIDRYKNSSAIFAWELCNEPRCSGCPSSVVHDWAASTSAYIKSLDPAHMVTLGDEGWFNGSYGDGTYGYSGAEGVDFVQNLDISTLDYAVFHLYPDAWGYNETWGATWIEQHADAAAKAGKPVVLEEYWAPWPENRTEILQPWQRAVIDSGVAADQMWSFATVLPSGLNFEDSYDIPYDTTPGSQFDVLVLQNVKDMANAPILN